METSISIYHYCLGYRKFISVLINVKLLEVLVLFCSFFVLMAFIYNNTCFFNFKNMYMLLFSFVFLGDVARFDFIYLFSL